MSRLEKLLEHHLVGKIYIKADFWLQSPLLIGSGESEHSDIDVIRDEPFNGIARPIIPATSVVGVFRHLFDQLYEKGQQIVMPETMKKGADVRDVLCEFFGVIDDSDDKILKKLRYNRGDDKWDLNQSALMISDIVLDQKIFAIVQRDGVRIDPRTGTAVEHAKFDYEIVEPPKKHNGNAIRMIFEINVRNSLKESYTEIFKAFVGYFLQEIDNGRIRFGAKTNKGFGHLKLVPDSIKVTELDLQKALDVKQWLTTPRPFSNRLKIYDKHSKVNVSDLIGGIKLALDEKTFTIDATFHIKNSMLVRSYSTDPREPDLSHIKCSDDFILPGTSIMGAVRHRAWKIINTMFKEQQSKLSKFHNLFGYVHIEQPNADLENEVNYPGFTKEQIEQKVCKGRVRVDETVIDNVKQSIIDRVQTRIKIDRFTGGTMAGALLQEKALWQKDNEPTITINMQIRDYEPWEPALFMFILKDLVTGDLPIGGEKSIGRGVLIGNEATISWTGKKPIGLEFDVDGFVKEKDQKKLDDFANFIGEWRKLTSAPPKEEAVS